MNALLLWKHPHPSLAVANYPTARRLRGIVLAFPVHQELTPAKLRQVAGAVRRSGMTRYVKTQTPRIAVASRIHMALTGAAMT